VGQVPFIPTDDAWVASCVTFTLYAPPRVESDAEMKVTSGFADAPPA